MREDGGVSELVEWLRYRLDEDERVARAAIVGGGSGRWAEDSAWLTDMLDPLPSQRRERPGWVPMITRKDVAHIARHDPARVLAEVEAKRRPAPNPEFTALAGRRGHRGRDLRDV
jgi:hypothetical protein